MRYTDDIVINMTYHYFFVTVICIVIMQQENTSYEYHASNTYTSRWRALSAASKYLQKITKVISYSGNVRDVLERVTNHFTILYSQNRHNTIYRNMRNFVTKLLEKYSRDRDVNYLENKIVERLVLINEEMDELNARINSHVGSHVFRDLRNTTHASPRRHSFPFL